MYVERLAEEIRQAPGSGVRVASKITMVQRLSDHVILHSRDGVERYDDVVIAVHAPQALSLLADPSPEECEVLSAFAYSDNLAVLHEDPSFMPRRKAAWSSWNVTGTSMERPPCVTYWMNRLQRVASGRQFFVTLNPDRSPANPIARFFYDHPLFDAAAMRAQRALWSLQGQRHTWFCGAYFGAGFHEDGLQAGLAVAEALGKVRRPWSVPDESGRIEIREPGVVRSQAAYSP